MALADQLLRAREIIGYSQEDVAQALGVSRAMISYWESGRRRPNDRQLVALSALYRVPVDDLLGKADLAPTIDLAAMLLRTETDLPTEARPGVEDWAAFLELFTKLSEAVGVTIPGMHESPFLSRSEFETSEDARRKAEEVRSHLRLGLGPVADMDWVCELLGITVYRTELGQDLKRTISGAFFRHPTVGFSILANLDMTPGRRRFTVAHEIAHALFHSDKATPYVISRATNDPRERFADTFAGEFLMPTEGVRRFMEENEIGPRITDPADVIHIQRYFKVSYGTALVRLRRARFLTYANYQTFWQVRPVLLARALGYEIDDEEYFQDPELWRLSRYPRRFLHMLRMAVKSEVISVPTAASLTGLLTNEIAQLVSSQSGAVVPDDLAVERSEFEDSHVIEAAN
jgi:Zn-dependent peptidase ImmA (M78 family)/DNA-binding XRE family transcriptional regulator